MKNNCRIKNDPRKLPNFNNDIYSRDLTFAPFTYKESKGLYLKKHEYNSYFFSDDKKSKLYDVNKNLLICYLFNSKKYINEFIQKNNNILEFLNGIGGSVFLIYILFYGFNYIINERIKLRNFQLFLDDKDNDLIQRHINYEKIKICNSKSNINSNDLTYKNEGYNAFKPAYFFKNESTNISNINNCSNEENLNQKSNLNNNYAIKINKNRNDEDKIEEGNKSDNIFVINNNSFMNNKANNKFIQNDALEKYNTIKLENKYNKFENLKDSYCKAYTYNKSACDSPTMHNLKTIIKNNDLDFVKIKKNVKIEVEHNNSKNNNDSAEFNQKNKIIDTSSVSLLNATVNQYKIQNILSSYNDSERKDTPTSHIDKFKTPNFFSKINTKIQDYSKTGKKTSFKNLNYQALTKTEEKNNNCKENKQTFITFDKERRKSNQTRFNQKSLKEAIDNYKSRRPKTRKTGAFLKLPENKSVRHLSLFSKFSINNYNSLYYNDKNYGNVSPTIRKSFLEQYKKTYHICPIAHKKSKKRQSSEFETKSIKKNKLTSIKNLNYQDNTNKFIEIIQNNKITSKNICNYICLCNNKENSIYILNNFRKKLLSEEYLYILHINFL